MGEPIDLTDTEMDLIWDEAWLDAINGSPHPDRYQENPARREFYEHAYRMHYHREHHW
jgi:hypothetical protein